MLCTFHGYCESAILQFDAEQYKHCYSELHWAFCVRLAWRGTMARYDFLEKLPYAPFNTPLRPAV